MTKELYEIEKNNFENLKLSNGRVDNDAESVNNCIRNLIFIPKRILIRMISRKPTVYNHNKYKWLEELNYNKHSKVAIYTCIYGNYDKLENPLYEDTNIDYYVFSNKDPKSKVWKYIKTPDHLKNYDNILKNRYIKLHPYEYFNDYDYVIYIDGNVVVMSDVRGSIKRVSPKYGLALHKHARRNCIYREGIALNLYNRGKIKNLKHQLKKYKKEKFPRNYGLLEATIIMSDPKSEVAKNILSSWWKEFLDSGSQRDQISLPYVLWKNSISVNEIGTLGSNLYRNPKYKVLNHLTSKARSK